MPRMGFVSGHDDSIDDRFIAPTDYSGITTHYRIPDSSTEAGRAAAEISSI